jgi:hypothetical protein
MDAAVDATQDQASPDVSQDATTTNDAAADGRPGDGSTTTDAAIDGLGGDTTSILVCTGNCACDADAGTCTC